MLCAFPNAHLWLGKPCVWGAGFSAPHLYCRQGLHRLPMHLWHDVRERSAIPQWLNAFGVRHTIHPLIRAEPEITRTTTNFRQGLSRNQNSKVSDLHSQKHFSGSALTLVPTVISSMPAVPPIRPSMFLLRRCHLSQSTKQCLSVPPTSLAKASFTEVILSCVYYEATMLFKIITFLIRKPLIM